MTVDNIPSDNQSDANSATSHENSTDSKKPETENLEKSSKLTYMLRPENRPPEFVFWEG